MNLSYQVTGNSKVAVKAAILLAKSASLDTGAPSGATIRKTEWPAWQRPRKLKLLPSDKDMSGCLVRYADAMGKPDADLDPRATNWEAYEDWTANDPKHGRCDVCGRGFTLGDADTCATCATWAETVAA